MTGYPNIALAGAAITTAAFVAAVIIAHQPKTVVHEYEPKVIAHIKDENGRLITYVKEIER